MNTYTQTLSINKLRNISYPEKSLTLFIQNLTEYHLNEIIVLKETYPLATIKVFTTRSKLSFLYNTTINILTILEINKIDVYTTNSIEEDILIIDDFIRIPLVYIDKSLNLNTSNVISLPFLEDYSFKDNIFNGLFSNLTNSYINIINNLTSSDIKILLDTVDHSNLELTSCDIPQFSNFDNSSINLLNVLSNIETSLNYTDIGLLLTKGGKKEGAYKKYGENQSKTAELLELVSISSKTPKLVSLTLLGKNLLNVDKLTFEKVIFFEILKCNLIKHLISLCKVYDEVNVKEICLKVLSEKTYIRRRPNIRYIINILRNQDVKELNNLLDKLIF